MKLGQLQEKISKASLLINLTLDKLFWKLTKEKFLSPWHYFLGSSKKHLQSSPNNVNYRPPVVIRYFLLLGSKPAAAYDDICYNEKNWDWICDTSSSSLSPRI